MLQAIFEYAKTNFGGFISDALILGAITFLLKLYFTNSFQKKLESHKGVVNSNLETHKGVVNSKIEGLKHDQQKAYKEFDLYTTRRHEIIPELYKKIELACGHILIIIRHYPDFENLHPGELREYMEQNNFGISEINDILETYQVSRAGAAQLILDTMRVVEYQKARFKWDDANEYFILNELYLTEEISDFTRTYLNNLFNYWTANNPQYRVDLDLISERRELSEVTLPQQRVEFKSILKRTLSESFSNNP